MSSLYLLALPSSRALPALVGPAARGLRSEHGHHSCLRIRTRIGSRAPADKYVPTSRQWVELRDKDVERIWYGY